MRLQGAALTAFDAREGILVLRSQAARYRVHAVLRVQQAATPPLGMQPFEKRARQRVAMDPLSGRDKGEWGRGVGGEAKESTTGVSGSSTRVDTRRRGDGERSCASAAGPWYMTVGRSC